MALSAAEGNSTRENKIYLYWRLHPLEAADGNYTTHPQFGARKGTLAVHRKIHLSDIDTFQARSDSKEDGPLTPGTPLQRLILLGARLDLESVMI